MLFKKYGSSFYAQINVETRHFFLLKSFRGIIMKNLPVWNLDCYWCSWSIIYLGDYFQILILKSVKDTKIRNRSPKISHILKWLDS